MSLSISLGDTSGSSPWISTTNLLLNFLDISEILSVPFLCLFEVKIDVPPFSSTTSLIFALSVQTITLSIF